MIKQIKEFIVEYKMHLIIIAVMLVGLLITNTITSEIKNSVNQGLKDVNADIIVLKNEFQQYKTEAADDLQYEQITSQNSEVKWLGDKVDVSKWKTDNNLFWDYISPAFNYTSGDEYMAHRQQYVNDLGNCVFTVHFLTPIFKETVGEEYYNKLTCYGLKSNFEAYPTSMHTVLDDNGNIVESVYDYIAFVKMQPNKNTTEGSRTVIFTYTLDDKYNLTNLQCYPVTLGVN